eukprot:3261453-Amphidinium_carterae.1
MALNAREIHPVWPSCLLLCAVLLGNAIFNARRIACREESFKEKLDTLEHCAPPWQHMTPS